LSPLTVYQKTLRPSAKIHASRVIRRNMCLTTPLTREQFVHGALGLQILIVLLPSTVPTTTSYYARIEISKKLLIIRQPTEAQEGSCLTTACVVVLMSALV
jgi:hypothetical protein